MRVGSHLSDGLLPSSISSSWFLGISGNIETIDYMPQLAPGHWLFILLSMLILTQSMPLALPHCLLPLDISLLQDLLVICTATLWMARDNGYSLSVLLGLHLLNSLALLQLHPLSKLLCFVLGLVSQLLPLSLIRDPPSSERSYPLPLIASPVTPLTGHTLCISNVIIWLGGLPP